MPYVVDRFYSSSQKDLKEDDPAADHMQAEGSLPPFPVSSLSPTIKPCIRNVHRHDEYILPNRLFFFFHVYQHFIRAVLFEKCFLFGGEKNMNLSVVFDIDILYSYQCFI